MTIHDIESLASDLKYCTDDERLALLSEIQQKENYLRVLNGFAVSLIGISTYDDLVWYVAKEVVAKLGFVDCVLYQYDDAKKLLVQRAASGGKNPEGRELVNPLSIPFGKGVTGRVAETREAIIVADLSQEANYVEDISPAASEICVPLEFDGKLLGVIDCEDPRRGHFNEDHLEILESVASMTSSKIKECEVVENLGKQAQILSRVNDAVVISNMEGYVTECNSGAVSLFGYDSKHLIGSHVSELIGLNAEWMEGRAERLAQLDNNGVWRGPVKLERADGKIITIDVSSTPLRDKSGKHVASISVGRDISSLVEAEQKLKESNFELRHQQAELEQALKDTKAAQSAKLAKDTFLANTSHGLRTPLAGVMGMIDLLDETALNSEQKELLSIAGKSANTLLFLINEVLDLSKLDTGKIALQEEAVNLVGALGAAAESLRPEAEAKGLRYRLVMPHQEHVYVRADQNRLLQIMFNLIGNAIKYTEVGDIEVCLSLSSDGSFVDCDLSVKDTGVGFNAEAAGRIFERFEQVDATNRKHAQGAGLGLALASELAELMGGSIVAKSQPDAGAVFRFEARFPCAAGPERQDVTNKIEEIEQKEPALDLNILVAEDNDVNQILVRKLLNLYGWSSTFVENGLDAVAALKKEHSFDLVLMDIRMPVMDGIEATKEIRQLNGPSADIPIVALTANALPSDQQEFVDLGMNALVPKPIDKALLKATILAQIK